MPHPQSSEKMKDKLLIKILGVNYTILKLRLSKKALWFITVRSHKHYNPSSSSSDLALNSDRLLSISLDNDVNSKLKILNDTSCLGCARPNKDRENS